MTAPRFACELMTRSSLNPEQSEHSHGSSDQLPETDLFSDGEIGYGDAGRGNKVHIDHDLVRADAFNAAIPDQQ